MKARFWGVRGSCPTPLGSEEVSARLEKALWHLGQETKSPDLSDHSSIAAWVASLPPTINSVVGGNTSCVEVRTSSGDLLVLDSGSGIRALGDHLMKGACGQGEGRLNVLLSHYHWDHIQGWPFFKPAYVPGNRLDFYTRHEECLEPRLRRQQEPPFFPASSWKDMRADISFHQMGDEPLLLCDGRIRVTATELVHPSRAYAYRIEADDAVLVYASDATYEQIDPDIWERCIEFYHGADLLIFDAQFTASDNFAKRSWGHSSANRGVELCCLAGVRRLALYHHDPGSDDDTLQDLLHAARKYEKTLAYRSSTRCEIFLAREGMTVQL